MRRSRHGLSPRYCFTCRLPVLKRHKWCIDGCLVKHVDCSNPTGKAQAPLLGLMPSGDAAVVAAGASVGVGEGEGAVAAGGGGDGTPVGVSAVAVGAAYADTVVSQVAAAGLEICGIIADAGQRWSGQVPNGLKAGDTLVLRRTHRAGKDEQKGDRNKAFHISRTALGVPGLWILCSTWNIRAGLGSRE